MEVLVAVDRIAVRILDGDSAAASRDSTASETGEALADVVRGIAAGALGTRKKKKPVRASR